MIMYLILLGEITHLSRKLHHTARFLFLCFFVSFFGSLFVCVCFFVFVLFCVFLNFSSLQEE